MTSLIWFILLPVGVELLGVGGMLYAHMSNALSFYGSAVLIFPMIPAIVGAVLIILAVWGLRKAIISEVDLRKIRLIILVFAAITFANSFFMVTLHRSIRQHNYDHLKAVNPNARIPPAKSDAFIWFLGVPFLVMGLLIPIFGSHGQRSQ
jgi:hypothetical protein